MSAQLSAAVAELLGTPVPAFDDPEHLEQWLAARGVGLIAVADPQAFSWPGHWIAVTVTGRAVVMYGTPSGALSEAATDAEAIDAGFVLAQHDLDLERRTERTRGVVASIVVAPQTAGPAHELDRCRALVGRGLDGDRYATGGGTFAGVGRMGQDLTLIDADALEAAGVSAVDARRNIVTRGIDLDVLVGRRFRIGDVICMGERRAEPCAHLQRLTRPGVLRALVHRGGIRADVISGGHVAVGDVVELADGVSV